MKKIVMIALVALTFVACEKEIEVDIEGTDPKVVVHSLNEVGQPVSLHLTYSRPVFSTFYVPTGSSYFEEVDNATVNLTVNGTDVGTAVRDGGTYSFGYVPSEGDQLDLRVVVPGEDPITASAIVPSRPMVKGVDVKYLENSETDEYDYYYDYDVDIRLTLMDKAATADFYSIRVYEYDTGFYTYYDSLGNIERYDTTVLNYYYDNGRPREIECSDYQIIDANMDIDDIFGMEPGEDMSFFGSTLYFTDGNINGTEHPIKLSSYLQYKPEFHRHGNGYVTDEEIKVWVCIEVTAYSRDMYLYGRTTDNYQSDELLGLFGEPVQIHSNINGGIGVFGVSSKTMVKIKMTNE